MSGRPIADLRDPQTHTRSTVQSRVRSIIVVGAGGHGRELADIVLAVGDDDGSMRLLGVVDDGEVDRSMLARASLRFLGTSAAIDGRDCDVLIGVGDPTIRAAIADRLQAIAPSLIHPSAQVGSSVSLAEGSVLAQGVIVTTNVSIGRHSHVNIAATISHDCQIGDFVTICPGVRVTGTVSIGDRAFIGAGATLLPGVSIGHDALVGAGAVVTADVAPATTVAGVPARVI